MKFVVPGHNYLGPGNKLHKPYKPTDKSDYIALQHDLAYNSATSEEDIRSADYKAIKQFGKTFITDFTWCSAVGFLGLGAKYLAESFIGVQYPRMDWKTIPKSAWTRQHWAHVRAYNKNNKRLHKEKELMRRRQEQGDPDSSKRQKIVVEEEPDSLEQQGFPVAESNPQPSTSTAMETSDVVDTGGLADAGGRNTAGSAVAASANMEAPMYKSPCVRSTRMTFHKEHNFLLWGNRWLSGPTTMNDKQVGRHICTSFADFPVNYLGFYMNEADFDMLPKTADIFVDFCSVDIIPMGETTSFLTGTTLSSSASAYHFLHGMFAVGLNRNLPTTSVEIKLKEGSMEVDKAEYYKLSNIRERLYGITDSSDAKWLQDYPTSLKHFRDWNYRTCLNHPGDTTSDKANKFSAVDSGQYDLTKFVYDFNWMECKDRVFHYDYKPTFAPIMSGRHMQYNGFINKSVTGGTILPCADIGWYLKKNNDNSIAYMHENSFGNEIDQTEFERLDQVIEKGPSISHIGAQRQRVGPPPSLNFGLYPTRSNTPTSEFETVNSAVYIKVATKIDIEIFNDSITTYRAWNRGNKTMFGTDLTLSSVTENVHEYNMYTKSKGKPF
nr:ORF4 [Afoambidensovirus incertum 1]